MDGITTDENILTVATEERIVVLAADEYITGLSNICYDVRRDDAESSVFWSIRGFRSTDAV